MFGCRRSAASTGPSLTGATACASLSSGSCPSISAGSPGTIVRGTKASAATGTNAGRPKCEGLHLGVTEKATLPRPDTRMVPPSTSSRRRPDHAPVLRATPPVLDWFAPVHRWGGVARDRRSVVVEQLPGWPVSRRIAGPNVAPALERVRRRCQLSRVSGSASSVSPSFRRPSPRRESGPSPTERRTSGQHRRLGGCCRLIGGCAERRWSGPAARRFLLVRPGDGGAGHGTFRR